MRLEDLSGIAVVFVVLAVVLGIGSTILGDVKEQACENIGDGAEWNATSYVCNNASDVLYSYSYNATHEGVLGLEEISSWQSTLAVIVVAAVVIGVVGYFYTRRQ